MRRVLPLAFPHLFADAAAQRVVDIPSLCLRFVVLRADIMHQPVLVIVAVAVCSLVVHPVHAFRDAVGFFRKSAKGIVTVQIQVERPADILILLALTWITSWAIQFI